VRQECPACHGEGQVIEKPCRKCGGKGRVRTQESFQIHIRPGVNTGSQLRVSGRGNAGLRGGRDGDLYVFIHVKPSKIFERSDDDLLCEVPVPITVLANGGVIEVPTISGCARMQVPSGTQSGAVLRLKGKGVPSLRGGSRGDLHVRVVVETPVKLTREQQELLDKFNASLTSANQPRKSRFTEAAGNFLRSDDGAK
ncbi:MAG: molecular chaperone DnaJ, partial [Lentisphaeria bacterium]|nr:molecular chaperone DnaJ [Lentisphaeria bacterium]